MQIRGSFWQSCHRKQVLASPPLLFAPIAGHNTPESLLLSFLLILPLQKILFLKVMISSAQRRKNPKLTGEQLFTRKNFPDEAREIVSRDKRKKACVPLTITWKIRIVWTVRKWKIAWKNLHSFNWKYLDSCKIDCKFFKLPRQISICRDGPHTGLGQLLSRFFCCPRKNFPGSDATLIPRFLHLFHYACKVRIYISLLGK